MSRDEEMLLRLDRIRREIDRSIHRSEPVGEDPSASDTVARDGVATDNHLPLDGNDRRWLRELGVTP